MKKRLHSNQDSTTVQVEEMANTAENDGGETSAEQLSVHGP